MAYVYPNYPTKKALREAITAGVSVQVFQPGPFSGNIPASGRIALEGPHYPKPHRWYATGTMLDGKLVKVA